MNRPTLLVVGDQDSCIPLGDDCQVIKTPSLAEALACMQSRKVDAVLLQQVDQCPASLVLEAGGFLEQIPDGIALIGLDTRIVWSNQQLDTLAGRESTVVGEKFFDAFPKNEILGPDFDPLSSVIGSGQPASTIMRVGDKSYLSLKVTPLCNAGDEIPTHLIVIVRDFSSEYMQRQKLDAIYRAGSELGDLQPDEVTDLSEEDRIELLKSKILHYTKDILGYESVEIRLLERESGELKLLLAVGFEQAAMDRKLYASADNNGVTGFVAATGRSYLCLDTEVDKKYIPGAAGARSSITVPLVLRNEILGTFNVESPRSGAFGDNDLQFLELFCREVAQALNTLELLVAEQATTVAENTTRILCEVADPVDEILNSAIWLQEKITCDDPRVAERLQQILDHVRQIRESILEVGDETLLNGGHCLSQTMAHSTLKGKRILIVDGDKEIRRSGHELLGRLGCSIETAIDGAGTFFRVRTRRFDVVIADIRLSDVKGDEMFRRLREIDPRQQVILMAGFGYDSNHTIVKARQMGLQSVIYKPFRREQLLKALELAIATRAQADAADPQ